MPHEPTISNVQMRRLFPDLTAKTQIVLLELEGEARMYARDPDGWVLLGGEQECAASEDTAPPLSGVDRPDEGGGTGDDDRAMRDGAVDTLPQTTQNEG